MASEQRQVFYVYDTVAVAESKNIPNLRNRAAVVHSLISAYSLLGKCKLDKIEEAKEEDLKSFHCSDYIECLKGVEGNDDLEKLADSEDVIDFNLGYDCPLFGNVYHFAQVIAGSSLTAARKLVKDVVPQKNVNQVNLNKIRPKSYLKYKVHANKQQETKAKTVEAKQESCTTEKDKKQTVAINWFGGWHHAERDQAQGFCYVNDIVIAIQFLLQSFKRVLYIDFDVHHGNGVENAFVFSPRVLTFDIHRFEAGFYPATGALHDIGRGPGRYHAVNVPLKAGIRDDAYVSIFTKIFAKIMSKFKPECMVVQCGADSIAGDPLGGFNLTLTALGECLRLVLNQQLPTLVLGGGGYNIANTARCWAYLTSVIVGSEIGNDIPDNQYFFLFGPDFELGVSPSLRKDENSHDYLRQIVKTVLDNLENLPL